MANAVDTFLCPACGLQRLSLVDFESLMVLRPDLGLFTLICPHCESKISLMRPIPAALEDEVSFAAIEMGAGMGRPLG